MEGAKEMFLIMRQEDFNNLPQETRTSGFIHIEVREANEYETHKSDPVYVELYKKQKKAKKELQEYLFNKRHK